MATIGRFSLAFDGAADRLLREAATVLQAAELDEALGMVMARLIGNGAAFQVERVAGAPGGVVGRIQLAPFAELALLEVARIARSEADSATKTKWVEQALTMGGY